MPRLRIMAYAIVAAVILVSALLWSGVIASPINNGDTPQWGPGPEASTVPVNLTITLQRPNSPPPSTPWIVPVTLTFYTPGADPTTTAPLYTLNVTLLNTGKWIGDLDPVVQGTYDIRVRNLHTLRNLKKGVVIGPSNNLNMGTLLEGDANADNKVGAPDFQILRAAYFSNEGGPNWDPRADFDEDNKIRSSDFALLSLNYFKSGDIDITGMTAQPNVTRADAASSAAQAPEAMRAERPGKLLPNGGTVALALTPRLNRAAAGQVLSLTLNAQAGDQPFVAADAEITFPVDALQVVDANGNPSSTVEVLQPFEELINKVDNANGTIFVGAGKFGDAVSGDVPLAKMYFKVVKSGVSDVKLVDCSVADPNGKFVTGALYGARVVPSGYTTICLPMVAKEH